MVHSYELSTMNHELSRLSPSPKERDETLSPPLVERSFDRLPPMKNPLHYIEQYPERTKGLLGISYDQFLRLTAQAQLLEEQRQAEIERTRGAPQCQRWGMQAQVMPKRGSLFMPVLLETASHL